MRLCLCVFLGSLAAALLVPAALGAEPADEPFKLADTALEPVKWTDLAGWAADDHLAAFATYLTSCRALRNGKGLPSDERPLYNALSEVCRRAAGVRPADKDAARRFFEDNFRPVHIARLGEPPGFLTGYYQPIVEGSRFPNPDIQVPPYRRPPELMAAGLK